MEAKQRRKLSIQIRCKDHRQPYTPLADEEADGVISKKLKVTTEIWYQLLLLWSEEVIWGCASIAACHLRGWSHRVQKISATLSSPKASKRCTQTGHFQTLVVFTSFTAYIAQASLGRAANSIYCIYCDPRYICSVYD